MAGRHGTEFDIGHPAPDRGRVSRMALLFGLGGAAAAWSLQIAVTSALAGVACSAGDGPKEALIESGWAPAAIAVVNIAALLVAFAALGLSWRNLNRTHKLERRKFGGAIDAGEGRTRFMSIWGVFAGILFILAIGFNTVSVFWMGLCGG